MDRYESTKIAGIIGIIGNIFLLIIKSFIGFISHSQAMIADAANSAGDIFASIMIFIGNKIASEPKDKSHNFGHGKAEYVFSLFISISMMFVASKLLIDCIINFITNTKFIFSWFLIIVCIITIIVKFILFIYTKKLYKSNKNLLLKSNMIDHRNDCILTVFTLLSIILGLFNIYWVDPIVGFGISLWIFYTGMKIFIESYNVLMDKSLDTKTNELILDLIHEYKEIQKIDEICSSPIGYQFVVTVNIYIDGNMSTFDSHKIADTLEKNIEGLDNIAQAIVHVNPI